jgi:transcriptional regulator with XRE-family HTH domain
VSTTALQAREALGQRLRELRCDARLTGKELALLAGWQGSKISKIEYGKQTPSESDIRVWCDHCRAENQVDELIATVRNIEAMYVEWRRRLRTGTRRRQEVLIQLEAETSLLSWYEPVLVPGMLHTSEYAKAVMSQVISFYEIPDDLDAGVAARMERQQVLYRGDHRFHFVLAEQALDTRVGDESVMLGQLDRLLTILSFPRVQLGIVPSRMPYRVPTNQFIMFDDRTVHVETVSAELTVTQPREIALYIRAFRGLTKQAVYGTEARNLIQKRISRHDGARVQPAGSTG